MTVAPGCSFAPPSAQQPTERVPAKPAREVIPMNEARSLPVRVRVCHLRVGSEIVTSIYREWTPSPNGTDGRCEFFMVNTFVSREDAPTYSPRAAGARRVEI